LKKLIITPFLVLLAFFTSVCSAEKLREVIVSHTDNKGVLQLFRKKEDGSGSVQITHSEKGCRMPVVSPDGKKLVYVQLVNHSLSLWLSDINGKDPRVLKKDGMNLLPSWLPDSRHIVWMKARQGKKIKTLPAIARSTFWIQKRANPDGYLLTQSKSSLAMRCPRYRPMVKRSPLSPIEAAPLGFG